MQKNKINFIAITAFALIIIMPIYAQGKSDLAPGKNKQANLSNKKVNIGNIENLGTDTLTIQNKVSKQKTDASIDSTTKVVGQDKKLLKIGALKLKDLIAVISTDSGEIATSGAKLKVKKIFVKEATQSTLMKRQAVQGIIDSIDGTRINLTHQTQRSRTFTVIYNETTIIKSKNTEASGSASISVLEYGQRIVAVGDLGPNGEIIAKRIHIIPGKAAGIFKKQPLATPATPSASLFATPSASATTSATPFTSPSIIPTPSIYPTTTPVL
jgi:hypothetical protein